MTETSTNSINAVLANYSHLSNDVHIRPKIAKDIMGISIATFWRLVKSGQLKTHKLTERTTTVKVADLRAFMEGK